MSARQQISCANCIYGDYWYEPDNWDTPEEFGFDCNYPNVGSKLVRELRTDWNIDDEEMAPDCPEYQQESAETNNPVENVPIAIG
jgi:hypothetical protein